MEKRRVIVPVATLWTSPTAPRDIDQLALDGDTKRWVAGMTTAETIDLCDSKRLETQAVFNDEVIIDHVENGWAKVYLTSQKDDADERGYAGWVPTKLLSAQGVTDAKGIADIHITTPFAMLYDEQQKPVFEIVMGTELTELAAEGDWLRVATPLGEGYVPVKSTTIAVKKITAGEQMVAMARQFLGLRYLWAGISPYGFDCSGLMYTLHRVQGLEIPRDADDQRNNGQPVKPENLQAGDLLFFAYEHGKGFVHHVGMYIGDGQMIQSRTPGKQVDIAKLTEMRYAPEFVAARRYWQ
ncbi:cell wall-associated hydrolase [Secundilactobacillus pentosiphilus]|uniref:Cell wall-associated hydrolase n=1 Tax=Secundilactobacillus pentosiphilus TaxID=1714682 RepID=A0A1Z5IP95_9LACO|nr:C40 family peptidase [Secundilactobacillus pentosiphilus]GAX03577.1 cell wall-associated hydrolase [Secundilactobacillus pentosiphilus]